MIPKYKIVIKELEQIIRLQEVNTMVPSERILSEKLNISRMTVRKAVEILVNKGKLYRVANKGTFVADKKLFKLINSLDGFTNEVKQSGGTPINVVLEYACIQAEETVSAKLSIEENSMIHKVVRLRMNDDLPVMIDVSYFPADIIQLDEEIIRGSIYNHITKCQGLSMSSAIREVRATFIPTEFKGLLNLKDNEPIISVESIGFLVNGRIFEYSISYKDQKRYELIIQSIRKEM